MSGGLRHQRTYRPRDEPPADHLSAVRMVGGVTKRLLVASGALTVGSISGLFVEVLAQARPRPASPSLWSCRPSWQGSSGAAVRNGLRS